MAVDDAVNRLRAGPALTSGPLVLVAVLAIVIVALAVGLAAAVIGPDAGAIAAASGG